ncbi:DUF4336 domain-containing protein [Marinobacter fonticola]|uniref:DUF4336 domain-containing protein n=1 Tax=Marinobacter fonticola TaxID=2603215 RepID=UPI001D0DB5C5|nr:DUF4336 domain-containing protein [Marinobacter fonticola]
MDELPDSPQSLHELAENVWIVDGETVPFHGFPYTTRMTCIRLADGSLWVHSPVRLTPHLHSRVSTLGTVRYLIAPNHLHHLFIGEWQQAFPEASLYGTAQVIGKRKDLTFDAVLDSQRHWPWSAEIDQIIFSGSRMMEEAVFFHRPSATLIVADLIENFPAGHFNWWQQPIARLAGIVAPHGKTPLDWRLTFNRRHAQDSLTHIKAWVPKFIVMAHGEIVEEKDNAFLNDSFDWLE